jgi:hypothetical protein
MKQEKKDWNWFALNLKTYLQSTQVTKEREAIIKEINIAISVDDFDEACKLLEQAIKQVEI